MSSFEAALGGRRTFTDAQWQEMEHQVLILKYLLAGVPVPLELIVPIRRSFEALTGRYYHPSMSYYSYYGKRPDPEPGRCRRTDGKKWRCSKDAYPGSKYCERHMHRGRNRSRKPVESQTVSPTKNTSSTLTSFSPASNNTSGSGAENFKNIHSTAGPSTHIPCINVTGSSQLPVDAYTLSNRYFSGLRADVDEHRFFSEASGSAKVLGVDNPWHLMSTWSSTFPQSKLQDSFNLRNAYPQLQLLQDHGQVTLPSLSGQQCQDHSLFGSESSLTEPAKHETQSLRPFFEEWPKARDSWRNLDDNRSNRASFSTTQLSISIPMTSPDFTSTSSRSPNGGIHSQTIFVLHSSSQVSLLFPLSYPLCYIYFFLQKIDREGISNTSSPLLNLRRTSVQYCLWFL
ncbi:growth-regulating factor 5-like isoform X1 [Zingiber officinale]|uniref:growth-regulating factor 5-like isoform X1 n=1 Tax=Zingiber officinale TaxID=94328 RepID=UPI001C4D79E7|nr:growth-regulating factor 5-like isoform X1 [Zingiber officinale]